MHFLHPTQPLPPLSFAGLAGFYHTYRLSLWVYAGKTCHGWIQSPPVPTHHFFQQLCTSLLGHREEGGPPLPGFSHAPPSEMQPSPDGEGGKLMEMSRESCRICYLLQKTTEVDVSFPTRSSSAPGVVPGSWAGFGMMAILGTWCMLPALPPFSGTPFLHLSLTGCMSRRWTHGLSMRTTAWCL